MMKLQSVDKSLIQIDVEAENFEDAVRKSMEPLVAQKYVKPSYVEKILSIYRETGPYIVITTHIALPHADSEAGALKMGMGFTKLKHPVVSGNVANDPVKYLFPLSATDSTKHIQMLSKLAELLGDPSFIEGLDTVTSKEEFIALLTKYEGNEQHDA